MFSASDDLCDLNLVHWRSVHQRPFSSFLFLRFPLHASITVSVRLRYMNFPSNVPLSIPKATKKMMLKIMMSRKQNQYVLDE